nr:MAG TPA: Honey bee toxin [Caudoviricetes sp.]DAY74681.1 MAG TPA: Honey bee toxin [Caudoviricetes sp.]
MNAKKTMHNDSYIKCIVFFFVVIQLQGYF